jgi:hypothetical protein
MADQDVVFRSPNSTTLPVVCDVDPQMKAWKLEMAAMREEARKEQAEIKQKIKDLQKQVLDVLKNRLAGVSSPYLPGSNPEFLLALKDIILIFDQQFRRKFDIFLQFENWQEKFQPVIVQYFLNFNKVFPWDLEDPKSDMIGRTTGLVRYLLYKIFPDNKPRNPYDSMSDEDEPVANLEVEQPAKNAEVDES